MKRNLSLSLEANIYQEVKRTIPTGQISPIVNNLLKEYLTKKKEQELKKAYQDFVKNQKLKKELEVWDEAVGDGVKNKAEKKPRKIINNFHNDRENISQDEIS